MVYAPLGPPQLAIEDIALLRAVPNMTIVAPADADEMRRLMPLTVDYPGPIYIRLAKGYDPIVTTDQVPFEIGRAIPMARGSDALIITTGITLGNALKAVPELAERGMETAVLHCPTVKPLDVETILAYAGPVQVVVTMEEHSVIGGLGSAVAEIIAESGFNPAKRFRRMGLPDVFPDQYGSQESLMASYSLTTERLVDLVTELADLAPAPAREA